MVEMRFASSELPGDVLRAQPRGRGLRGERGSQWLRRFLHP